MGINLFRIVSLPLCFMCETIAFTMAFAIAFVTAAIVSLVVVVVATCRMTSSDTTALASIVVIMPAVPNSRNCWFRLLLLL